MTELNFLIPNTYEKNIMIKITFQSFIYETLTYVTARIYNAVTYSCTSEFQILV